MSEDFLHRSIWSPFLASCQKHRGFWHGTHILHTDIKGFISSHLGIGKQAVTPARVSFYEHSITYSHKSAPRGWRSLLTEWQQWALCREAVGWGWCCPRKALNVAIRAVFQLLTGCDTVQGSHGDSRCHPRSQSPLRSQPLLQLSNSVHARCR